jgi:hypothetical protein
MDVVLGGRYPPLHMSINLPLLIVVVVIAAIVAGIVWRKPGS